MRITSGMMSSQYSQNLNRATYDLNRAATTAYDFRAFEKPSENPFLAAQTFQIRRQLALNENYSSNIENLKGAASSAQSTLQIVGNILANASDNSALKDLLAGITGTSNQSDRNSIADTLLTMRDAIVSDMNAQYGNRYLFSGAGGYGVAPFSVDSNGNLLYRGINVDTGINTNGASVTVNYAYNGTDKTMQINFGAGIGAKLGGFQDGGAEVTGYQVSIATGQADNTVVLDTETNTISIGLKAGATKQDLQNLLQGVNADGTEDSTFSDALSAAGISVSADDLSQITISNIDETGGDAVQAGSSSNAITNKVDLDALAHETTYVDIGLGMKTDADGNVVDQSAYNAAMPGISFLGYGMTTEEGVSVPKNVYSLLGDMADILKNDSLVGEGLMDAMKPYMDSFSSSADELSSSLAKLGTNVNFLDSTNEFIDNVSLSLNTKDENVEFVDSADAITNYTMQQFSYTAALQIGTNILQSTLLDFMK